MGSGRKPGPLGKPRQSVATNSGTSPRVTVATPVPIGLQNPPPSTERSHSSLIASGPEAIRRAAALLSSQRNAPDPRPFPSPFGDIPLKRGMISGHKYLIIYTDWQTTVYLDGPRLYGLRTADFVRNIWLDAIGEGMRRARHWIPIGQVVMGFVTGLLAGPVVIVTATVLVLALWASAHTALVEKGYKALGPAYRGLGQFKSRYPVLWSKVKAKVGQEFVDNLEDALKETITDPKNIAFFLGRVLRGVPGGPAGIPPSVPVGKILFVVVECAGLVTALHLPEGFVHLAKHQLKHLADELKKHFQKAEIGIALTEVEAQSIAKELGSDPHREALLKDLQKSLTDLKQVLEQFESDMKAVKGS